MRATSSLCTVCCCAVIVMCCIAFPLQGPVILLNQARPWFLEIDPVRTSVCVFACVCVCVRPRDY